MLCSPWATIGDVPPRTIARLAEALGIEPEEVGAELEPHLMRASEILWMLTRRVWYGAGCEEDATLRSSPPPPGTGSWPYHSSWGNCGCGSWFMPNWSGVARWMPNVGWAGIHPSPIAVQLPRSPVASVESVVIDGEPFAGWRLLRSGWLERIDGHGWSVCDALTIITYRFGEPPPLAGIMAAVEFGAELLLESSGSDECRLPPNVVSLSRQGVSMELQVSDATKMRTNLPSVDLWLDAVNPSQRPQAARVWSPDVPRTMRGATREV